MLTTYDSELVQAVLETVEEDIERQDYEQGFHDGRVNNPYSPNPRRTQSLNYRQGYAEGKRERIWDAWRG